MLKASEIDGGGGGLLSFAYTWTCKLPLTQTSICNQSVISSCLLLI